MKRFLCNFMQNIIITYMFLQASILFLRIFPFFSIYLLFLPLIKVLLFFPSPGSNHFPLLSPSLLLSPHLVPFYFPFWSYSSAYTNI